MKPQLINLFSQKRVQIGLLVAFLGLLYFTNLGQWDLWNPDEPRYAEVAREMVVNGDWILMHYNGNVYPDKPPLFFWLIGLSSYLWQGFTSFSVRLPAAFFGMLAVIVTCLLGRSLFGSNVGFISGLILATSFEFAFRSTRANIDSTLTFFTTASLLCFFHWYRSKGPSIYGLYVGMALATLAKGPVGFLLPLLVCLVFLIVQRDWKAIKGMKLLPGMLLMLVVVLSWYVPAVLKGGSSYLQDTLFKHSIARYSQGWAKVRPFYYYLYTFPMSFLPWAIFLPAALIYGRVRETLEKRKEYLFLFVWFAVIFLFFSVSKGKRGPLSFASFSGRRDPCRKTLARSHLCVSRCRQTPMGIHSSIWTCRGKFFGWCSQPMGCFVEAALLFLAKLASRLRAGRDQRGRVLHAPIEA